MGIRGGGGQDKTQKRKRPSKQRIPISESILIQHQQSYMSNETATSIFEKFGEIVTIITAACNHTLVAFKTSRAANLAINTCNHSTLDGEEMIVSYCPPTSSKILKQTYLQAYYNYCDFKPSETLLLENIGTLPNHSDEEKLKAVHWMLQPFGKLKFLFLTHDTALAAYENKHQAKSALEKLNRTIIWTKVINISYACPSTSNTIKKKYAERWNDRLFKLLPPARNPSHYHFLSQLVTILANEELRDIVQWDRTKGSIKIINTREMETKVLPKYYPCLNGDIQRLDDQLRFFDFQQQIYNNRDIDTFIQRNIDASLTSLHTQNIKSGPIVYKHRQTTHDMMSILTIHRITNRNSLTTLTNGNQDTQFNLGVAITPTRILTVRNFPGDALDVQIAAFLKSSTKYGNQIETMIPSIGDSPTNTPKIAYVKLHSIPIAMETLNEIRKSIFRAHPLSADYFDLLRAPNQYSFPRDWIEDVRNETCDRHPLNPPSTTTDSEILREAVLSKERMFKKPQPPHLKGSLHDKFNRIPKDSSYFKGAANYNLRIRQVYPDQRERHQDKLCIELSILAEATKELENNNYKVTRLEISPRTGPHIPSEINLPTTQASTDPEDSTLDHYAYQPNPNYNHGPQEAQYGEMNYRLTRQKPSSPPRKKQLLNRRREEESGSYKPNLLKTPPVTRADSLQNNTTLTEPNSPDDISTTATAPPKPTLPSLNIARETDEMREKLEKNGWNNYISTDLARALTTTSREHSNTPSIDPQTSHHAQTLPNHPLDQSSPHADTTDLEEMIDEQETHQVDQGQDEGKNHQEHIETLTASPAQAKRETANNTRHQPDDKKTKEQSIETLTSHTKPKRGTIARATKAYWDDQLLHSQQNKPTEPMPRMTEDVEEDKLKPSVTVTIRVNKEKDRKSLQATLPEHPPGTKVKKNFIDNKTGLRKPFSGEIVEFNPTTGYRIKYEDSDEEDLGILSTQTVVNNAREQPKETFKPGTFKKRLFDFVNSISIWPKKRQKLENNTNGNHTSN